MTSLPPFELRRPSTVAEALSLISPDDLPYVGGTELLLAMRERLLQPRSLVDLKRIEGLGDISVEESALTFGGTVTHRRLAHHPDVAASLPELTRMLNGVGNPRVQVAGTPAGNLCFAEPKSDVIPFLIALDAEVELTSSEATRSMPVADFIVGPYAAAREPDELLTTIRVPLDPERRIVYLKYQIMERPTVGVAAVRAAGRDRVVVGAAGLMPVSVESPQGEIEPDQVADAIEPLPDLTGSADYKRHVTAVYVRRALARLEEEA